MKRSELEEAAFWDEMICASCEAVFDRQDAADGSRCPECGSPQLVAAGPALLILESIEEAAE